MSNVFTQTVVYLALLFLGYGFKKAGIFKVEDTNFLKYVILYITMPATAVNGLKDLEDLELKLDEFGMDVKDTVPKESA